MTRTIRNSLCFLLGLLLGCFAAFASAETTPLVQVKKYTIGGSAQYDSPLAAHAAVYPSNAYAKFVCAAGSAAPLGYGTGPCPTPWTTGNAAVFWWEGPGNYNGSWYNTGVTEVMVNACLSGQNWTQQGSECVRPDCVSPQVRDAATGLCVTPPCQVGGSSSASWYTGRFQVATNPDIVTGTMTIPGSLCDGSCVGTVGNITSCVGSVNATPSNPVAVQCTANITLTGAQCSGGNGAAPQPPTVPNNSPPCASGQGIVEAGGTVKCVDQNQVPGSDTPKVNKQLETKTHPDGSQTITNTTTTCTGAGACSTVTNVTVTNASNGQPGVAGTPGTTSSTAEKPSEQQAEFCAKNPTLQICKGGMATEALQKETLDEVKKITTPNVSDDSSISGKTFESTTGRQDLTDKDDDLKNRIAGAVTPGEVAASKGAWESAMSSGWFDPIERGGCTPYTATISGRTWVWDYCEKAGQISDIGAYGLWIMLAFGVFVMLTGGNRS